ncbi:MAG TPA: hypothetical protein VK356_14525 [Thermomicrobiales bacterium]|nr:hypothetical protein [Thermomicrobiales bacterium]
MGDFERQGDYEKKGGEDAFPATSERGNDVTDETDGRRGEQEGDLRPEEAFVTALPS